jgi:LEA14-like dessication related protein
MNIAKKGGIEEPTVGVSKTKITGLSFDQADLLFDIEINNPNPIGIKLSGFDYDLFLNNTSFLKGNQDRIMEIKANDKAVIQLPLSIVYDDIFKTYQRLKDEDTITYALNSGLRFDLPVLGEIRIPVSTSGEFPSLKIPAIKIQHLKLSRLSLTGADFNLGIGINNPNSTGFIINTMKYNLFVNETQWADGMTSEKITIREKNDNTVVIPLSLNFLQIGKSVYQDISGGKNLTYQLSGQVNLSSTMEMLGIIDLPFNVSGQVNLDQ